MAKLGALIIHGMGDQEYGFGDDMEKALSNRITDLGADPSDVAWQQVHWAPVLEAKQEDLLDKLSAANNLDWMWLRKFVINSLGDAIAYLKRVDFQSPDVYGSIHEIVHNRVVELRAALGDEDKPLIVIAHSLGGVIMSNYIWDEQKHATAGQGLGGNPFEKMETLSAFFTFGCNISLVSLAYDPILSIDFPPSGLSTHFPAATPPDDLKDTAKWVNFFDADDVLGYPLKALSPTYRTAVSEDVEVNVGGLFTSWNPASHTRYWTDRDLVRPVAQGIVDVLNLL